MLRYWGLSFLYRFVRQNVVIGLPLSITKSIIKWFTWDYCDCICLLCTCTRYVFSFGNILNYFICAYSSIEFINKFSKAPNQRFRFICLLFLVSLYQKAGLQVSISVFSYEWSKSKRIDWIQRPMWKYYMTEGLSPIKCLLVFFFQSDHKRIASNKVQIRNHTFEVFHI